MPSKSSQCLTRLILNRVWVSITHISNYIFGFNPSFLLILGVLKLVCRVSESCNLDISGVSANFWVTVCHQPKFRLMKLGIAWHWSLDGILPFHPVPLTQTDAHNWQCSTSSTTAYKILLVYNAPSGCAFSLSSAKEHDLMRTRLSEAEK